jgi:hypothetical protein
MSKPYTSQQAYEEKKAFEELAQAHAHEMGDEMSTRFEELSERGKALTLAYYAAQDELAKKFRS